MKVDITKLNYKELVELEKEVKRLIEAKKEEEKKQFINIIKEMSLEAGFDLDELFGSISKEKTKTNKKKEVVVVKYKKSDGETWSGRGRKPLWVQEFINNGGDLEEFLILKKNL